MKIKYILILIILFVCNLGFLNAQDVSVIRTPVSLTQGYVLLEPSNDIDYWEVEILIRTYQDSINYTESVAETFEVIGDNYFVIPEEYTSNQNAYIRVNQFLSSGVINIETQKLDLNPPQKPGGGSEWLGEFKCNGSSYAWTIRQYGVKSNNVIVSSVFDVNIAVKSVDQITGIPTPYYQYFTSTQFSALRNQLTNQSYSTYQPYINGVYYTDYYYDGACFWSTAYNQPSAPNSPITLVQFHNDPAHPKKDASGAYISGSGIIYGVAKGLGPWGGLCGVSGASCFNTNFLAYTSFQGNLGLQWAMNLINTDSQSKPSNCNKPNLTCSSAGGSGPVINNPSWHVTEPKNRIKIIVNDTSTHFNWDFLSKVNELFGDEVGDWWGDYYSISLKKVSGNSSEVFNLRIADFFDANGEKIYVPISLEDGLYSIGIQFTDGMFISLLSERKISNVPTISNLSNHLTKTIFPVPITENSFSIALGANKDLSVVYKLFDFNMNLIYETQIQIGEGESSTIKINPDIPIPTGLLVNQFIFEDGSQSNVITTKSN